MGTDGVVVDLSRSEFIDPTTLGIRITGLDYVFTNRADAPAGDQSAGLAARHRPLTAGESRVE
jgi:hypothetical protein